MSSSHPRQIRRGTVVATVGALGLLGLALAPLSAQAAVCTQTVTGVNAGVFNVTAGEKLCLKHADQTGAVNVAAGGTLVVKHSVVTGAVTLNSGFKVFKSCDATIVGAVSASGGAGTVRIGGSGPSAGCTPNTIDGAVTLSANTGGLTLAGNTISGAVTATANAGAMTISANHIAGALACSGNGSAPANAGVANQVGGARTGECVDLTF
jgi:hypothetical protein